MADQFAGWTELLALAQKHKTKAALREAITKSGIQILETEPLSGYYRSAAVKDGPLLPVAIWRDETGALQVWRGGEPVKLERVWPYCVWHPISYEWYELVAEKGGNWPDAAAPAVKEQVVEQRPTEAAATSSETPTVAAASSTPTPTASSTEPANEESEQDKLTHKKEADVLKAQIEALIEAAKKAHLDIKSDEEDAAAQSARAALNKLSGDADKKRKALMQPWQSKADAIHEAWQPLVKLAKEQGANTILNAINKWLNVTKPAQLAAAAAEAAKNAPPVEATEDVVPSADGVVERNHNMQPPADPPRGEVVPMATPTTTVIKGATGRAATINEVKTATVTDYDALYAHVKAFPEVKTVLDRIAQRLVDAGQTPPGVKIDAKQKAS